MMPCSSEDFKHVPGNGLTFAVKVSGQVDGFGFARRLDDVLYMLLAAFIQFVGHRKIITQGSTAPSFEGRSLTWPYVASTWKSGPRYLLMVVALAGDSTISSLMSKSSHSKARHVAVQFRG